jgi:hypothetical protein
MSDIGEAMTEVANRQLRQQLEAAIQRAERAELQLELADQTIQACTDMRDIAVTRAEAIQAKGDALARALRPLSERCDVFRYGDGRCPESWAKAMGGTLPFKEQHNHWCFSCIIQEALKAYREGGE